jgi:hypothetical protein
MAEESEKIEGETISFGLGDAHRHVMQYWMAVREDHNNRPPLDWEIEAKDQRKTVVVRLLDGRSYDVPDSLTDAIEWLQGWLERVPKKLRDTAKISVDSESDYDSHRCEVVITYQRPETDAEWAARKADVERRHAMAVKAQEAADLAHLERLKAKYEHKS